MTPNYSTQDLPDYIRHTMAQAVGASGYRIIDRAIPTLEEDVRLQYANACSPFHHLQYKPGFAKHKEHMFLESATKVRRMWEAPAESRVIPQPTGVLPAKVYTGNSDYYGDECHQLPMDIQYYILYQSITQIPSDLRVYRQIIDEHPQHADALRSYAQDYTKWPVLFDPHSNMMVDELVEPMAAMYAAYAIEMNDLLGQGSYPKSETHDEIAQTLADRLYVGVPQGYQGDVVATESWASQLGIEEVYRWKKIFS